jgi:glutathione S-transferase
MLSYKMDVILDAIEPHVSYLNFGDDDETEKKVKEYHESKFLPLCKLLESSIQGKFFFGSSMTVVDIIAAAHIFKACYNPENVKWHSLQKCITIHPKLCAWVENVMKPELISCIKLQSKL